MRLSVHEAEISREEIEYLKRKNDVTRMHEVHCHGVLCCTPCMAKSISSRAGMTGMGAPVDFSCIRFSGPCRRKTKGLRWA